MHINVLHEDTLFDDEQDIRLILNLALSLDPEFEVQSVETGEELLARVHSEHFDALVLDGMMPGLDGYELCRMLKRTQLRHKYQSSPERKTQRGKFSVRSIWARSRVSKALRSNDAVGELRAALAW